ncbi:hypothetical protein CLV30_105148 [Haloactinopolyspora alba]|uniref:Acetyltransferase (GNAT) family protein n=1 Tax=Haloactinopolyspora alba TaxID=648780 RepID=A0A2P8E5F4_9ACTN|nr:hypothetical protein [Haloactinopolyspora alba]PSL04682.1 hypothetical protein CLV30_105148 [Haloactinopolyspora alba]
MGRDSLMLMDFVIRPYEASDRDVVLRFTPRISEGVAPWLDHDDVVGAFVGFAEHDVDRPASDEAVVLVAESSQGDVAGFATAQVQSTGPGSVRSTSGWLR